MLKHRPGAAWAQHHGVQRTNTVLYNELNLKLNLKSKFIAKVELGIWALITASELIKNSAFPLTRIVISY